MTAPTFPSRGKGLRPSEQVFVSVADTLGVHLQVEEVMPTGKTAADACGSCFCIHSEGQEDCW